MSHTTEEIRIDEHGRVLNDPTHAEPLSQGNSTAAWTLVLFVLIGLSVTAIGMLMANNIITWAGLGLSVVGLIVGFGLRAAGHGVYGKHTKAKAAQAQRNA